MNQNKEQSSEKVDEKYTCKVVLIGQSGVGKTSIISKFIFNKFSSDLPSTMGASYSCKNFYCKKYKQSISYNIWDTAGQEKYKSLTKHFILGAKIIIYVYDITKRNSFNELKNYWINETKPYAPKDSGK
jgi:small GTP-binding protein